MSALIVCDPHAPAVTGGLYHRPYIESVDGLLHGHQDQRGRVRWARHRPLADDPRCPQCHGQDAA